MHRIGFSLLQGPFDFGSFSVQVFELPVFPTASFTAQFFIVLSLLCGRVGESRAPKKIFAEAFSISGPQPKIQTSQPKVRFDARMATAGFSCVFCGHELVVVMRRDHHTLFFSLCCRALLLRMRVTLHTNNNNRQTDNREKCS
jgi:hypothetical protein